MNERKKGWMVNPGQTNGLGKAAFFHRPPEAIDLKWCLMWTWAYLWEVALVCMCMHIHTFCICVSVSTVHQPHLGKNRHISAHECRTFIAAELQLPSPVWPFSQPLMSSAVLSLFLACISLLSLFVSHTLSMFSSSLEVYCIGISCSIL